METIRMRRMPWDWRRTSQIASSGRIKQQPEWLKPSGSKRGTRESRQKRYLRSETRCTRSKTAHHRPTQDSNLGLAAGYRFVPMVLGTLGGSVRLYTSQCKDK